MESVQRVARVVKDEEHRYATTFLVAERVFNEAIKNIGGQAIPGAVSFKLYDTYGLALDEQEDMAREHGLAIDREGFEREMEQQRERARASWKGAEKAAVIAGVPGAAGAGDAQSSWGTANVEATARVVGLLRTSSWWSAVPERGSRRAGAGPDAVLRRGGRPGGRPRRALFADGRESGGCGERPSPGVPGLTVHRIRTHAEMRVGDVLRAEVAVPLRDATRRNHTATHLLHASLRQVLGTHVKQAGSVVEPGRLRFDFTHYAAMDRAELEEVERLMNEQILQQHGGEDEYTAARPGHRHRRHGAVRREVRRAGARGVRAGFQPGAVRRHARARAPAISACARSFTRAASRRACGVSRPSPAKRALRQYQETTGALRRIAEMVQASEPELVEHVEQLLAEDRVLARSRWSN